ncbi:hypothetical protein TcCL_Unassigned03482 [Trypanosoma cruzi]|nr:hypothetical protein TcCL_Unassigned03482 [Trypanosoma cruzi]
MHVRLPCGCGVRDPYFTLFGAAEVDGEVMQSRAARAWWTPLHEPVDDPSKSKCTMRFGSTGKEETVGGLGELQCTRLQKMACVAEFTLTATLGAFSRGRESFLIYLVVLDDTRRGRHFHFIRGWRTGDKDERERRLAKRAAAGTLVRLGIVCTASCISSAGCSLRRSLAQL